MKKIVIATKNKGKIKEMTEALLHLPVEVVSLAEFGDLPDAVEDGITFKENATIKAKFYQKQTGCACIADDSGLEIAVLDGKPGVYSARFSGEHADDNTNNAKMVEEIKKCGVTSSGAAYKCSLVFVDGDKIFHTEGSCEGTIRLNPQGTNGFGYDPYFYVGDKSMAEMTFAEKDKISHRGKALRKMVTELEEYFK